MCRGEHGQESERGKMTWTSKNVSHNHPLLVCLSLRLSVWIDLVYAFVGFNCPRCLACEAAVLSLVDILKADTFDVSLRLCNSYLSSIKQSLRKSGSLYLLFILILFLVSFPVLHGLNVNFLYACKKQNDNDVVCLLMTLLCCLCSPVLFNIWNSPSFPFVAQSQMIYEGGWAPGLLWLLLMMYWSFCSYSDLPFHACFVPFSCDVNWLILEVLWVVKCDGMCWPTGG